MIDINLEAQIIASMMDNDDNLCEGLAAVTDDDFTDPLYKNIFRVIRQMYEEEKTVNPQTVYREVEYMARGRGTAWMMDSCMYAGTFGYNLDKLKELTTARRAAEMAQKVIDGIRERRPVNEILVELEDGLFSLTNQTKQEPIVTPQQQAQDILDIVAEQMDSDKRHKSSIYTTFSKLNFNTGGYEAGDLVIVSGPTGGGKTAFTMNQMRDIAVKQKLPVLYINTEMSRKQMALRWASILSSDMSLTNKALRTGEFTQQQYGRLANELDGFYKGSLYSITIPDLTIPKMLSTIRRFSHQKKVRAVAIDYIGRTELQTGKDSKDEWKVLTNAARKLKTIAQQCGIVVFMLSQVDSAGKLAMAKYMEHEADLHLHVRPMTDSELQDTYPETCWNYAVCIEKGRSSPKGLIPVRFAGEKLLFITELGEAQEHAKLAGQSSIQRPNIEAATRTAGSRKNGSRRPNY